MMSFCSNCGMQVHDEDLFCLNCGEELSHHEEVVIHAPQSKKKKSYMMVALAGLLLLSGGGYLGWQMMANHATSSRSGKTNESISSAKIWNNVSNKHTTSTQVDTSEVKSDTNESSSESMSESIQKTEALKTVTLNVAPKSPIADLTIHQLFDNHFGAISGKHSLYFEDLTNAKGERVTSTPLVIQDVPIKSASTIKLFVLAALFAMQEKGEISLETVHHLKENDRVGGTGNIQNSPAGTPYTLRKLAHEMIVNSDNTAMNIIVDYIGMNNVNQYIRSLGYQHSSLNRKMLDTVALSKGIDNYISAKEIGDFMSRLYSHSLVSPAADKEMLTILSQQLDKTNLEAYLPSNVQTYNKTGQYAQYGIRNDVSIVSTDKGAYVLVVLSQDGYESEQVATMGTFGQDVYNTYINQKQ